MIREQDAEQSLLEIEILAVQIEQSDRLRRIQRAKSFTEALNKAKLQQYSLFKQKCKDQINSFLPIAIASATIGVLVTRTLCIGGLLGVGVGWLGKGYLSKQSQSG